jgi:hypothetical protein
MNLQNTLAFSTIPVSIDSHNVSAKIVEFVDPIINDKPVKTDAVEGMKTVATCVATVTSAKKGHPIKVRALIKAEGYGK